ncbi:MAG: methyltransferase domain-containing protein [Bacteroidota bacterium]|nr:methyltransferase domain-containing protein [Bacteroidota bacterium]
MIDTLKKFIRKNIGSPAIKERNVVEAYDIWADNYDSQPGNLMLDLDEIVFAELLHNIDIKNKDLADIGCGTGRHWPMLLQGELRSLAGFDVSRGMLDKLKGKYPEANTHVITDNEFSDVADNTYDVIVSTLTVAHIENIAEALTAWSRITKPAGDIIITDFHPNALASGGQRTFKHNNGHIAVRNYVHSTESIRKILLKNGFKVEVEVERLVDEAVKHYYYVQDAMHIYEKFKGFPIIYGIHFRRG